MSNDRHSRKGIFNVGEEGPIEEIDMFSDVAITRSRDRRVQYISSGRSRASSSYRLSRRALRRRNPILGVEGDTVFTVPHISEESGVVAVRRPLYSQSVFTRAYEENPQNDLNKQFLDNVFVPNLKRPNWTELLFQIFPFVRAMSAYRWRQSLLIDVVTGLTTGITRIPISMAYAYLARVRMGTGLNTAFIATVFYIIFGGSREMVVGPQGIVALMVGTKVSQYEEKTFNHSWRGSAFLVNSSNTDTMNTASINIILTLTFMAGLIQIALGVFQLGFISNYLSDPFIGGFTTGAACQVVVDQMKDILGISVPTPTGNFHIIEAIEQIIKKISQTNMNTVLISAYCFVVLILIKYLNYRINPIIPIPGELIVMASVIVFSYFTNAETELNVKVVGRIPAGFDTPGLPNMSLVSFVIDISFSSAIVSFAIGYSVAKRLAVKHDYTVTGNQEMFAFGVMNLASSFFHGFVATSTMPVTALNDSLGAVSQLANIVAAVIILLVIFFLNFVFEFLPGCVLSAITLVNLKGILCQFKDLKILWRVSKIDFLLWIVTWLSVVILDVDKGLLIGVTFSLLTVVFRTQWPYVCELGRIPSTDLYKNMSINPEAIRVQGIRIIRFEGSLYFASAEHFRKSLYSSTDCKPHPKAAANEKKCQFHHIIVDFSSCSFLDSVGLRTLNQCITEYEEAGITTSLANVRAAVRATIYNDAHKLAVGRSKTFLSVHDAVLAALEDVDQMDEMDALLRDVLKSSFARIYPCPTSDCDVISEY